MERSEATLGRCVGEAEVRQRTEAGNPEKLKMYLLLAVQGKVLACTWRSLAGDTIKHRGRCLGVLTLAGRPRPVKTKSCKKHARKLPQHSPENKHKQIPNHAVFCFFAAVAVAALGAGRVTFVSPAKNEIR